MIKKIVPPFTEVGPFTVSDQQVSYQTEECFETVLVGVVYVDNCAKCPITGKFSYTIVMQAAGEGDLSDPVTEIIPGEKLTKANVFTVLSKNGILVLDEALALAYLKECIKDGITAPQAQLKRKTLVRTPGWLEYDLGFFTGNDLVLNDELDPDDYATDAQGAVCPVNSAGSLPEWKNAIGKYAEKNLIVLAVCCVFISSLFLKRANIGSLLFNFYGRKGSGKTLVLQIASSIFGNGVDPSQGLRCLHPAFIGKFNVTVNGIEPLLARFSPYPLVLDELTAIDPKILSNLLYLIDGGQGKSRMTSSGRAAETHRWHLHVITSAEQSIVNAVTNTSRPLFGGQLDRIADICLEGEKIFGETLDLGSFANTTRILKSACARSYGKAGSELIGFAVNNPAVVDELFATEELAKHEAKLAPPGCGDGERRVVKRMAAAAAAGLLALRAGVFDCNEQAVLDAMRLLTKLWWQGRADCLSRIANYALRNVDKIQEGKPVAATNAKGFVTNELFVIPAREFELEFGDDSSKVLKQLASIGALRTEQEGRFKSRYDNNRFFGYAIRTSKIAHLI